MPRSNRRQETSSGSSSRQTNPQSYQSRGGGFEQRGTGRYDDQQRRFGQQNRGSGRNWPGQEDWRDSSERSRYFEGRDYGSDYEQEPRFGRGGFEGPRNFGRRGWSSEGYPESYRGFEGQEQERWGQGRERWDQGQGRGYRTEDESRYGAGTEGYGYGSGGYGMEDDEESDFDYSRRGETSGSNIQERFGGQQRRLFGSFGQGSRGFGMGSQSGQSRFMRGNQGSQQFGGGTSYRSFAGRGPQGYKRSDERITEEINEMLTQDPDIDAINITVEVQGGEVTLKGTVPDRESKRRAEDLAESSSGVKEVQNQLRVKREDESESESKREKSDEKRSHRQQLAS